jgi:hypothetical protein
MDQRPAIERFLSVYDTPIYRDWLAWVVLAVVVVVAVVLAHADGAWSLIGAPLGFVVYGWILGIPRNYVRGCRDGRERPAT